MIFPSKFIRPQYFSLRSEVLSYSTQFGHKVKVSQIGDSQRWALDFRTPPILREESRELMAFITQLKGQGETFTLPCPLPYMGSNSSFSVAATHAKGENQISVSAINGSAFPGDMIKFSNHDKAYMVNDLNLGVMTISPSLQSGVSATVTVQEAAFSVRLESNNFSIEFDGKSFMMPVAIGMIENV